jgi:hypothetical protein
VLFLAMQKEEAKQDAAVQLNPQERVSAVQPMWEQRGHADRVDLLTVDLSSLKQQAQQQAEKQRASAGGSEHGQAVSGMFLGRQHLHACMHAFPGGMVMV